MFKMPIFQRIAIMLDQSITLLPFLHMYHSIFLRGRHHLHWIMLPSWPRYHKLHRISDFYQHHHRTLVMKKLFFPFYCFTPAKILLVDPTISSAVWIPNIYSWFRTCGLVYELDLMLRWINCIYCRKLLTIFWVPFLTISTTPCTIGVIPTLSAPFLTPETKVSHPRPSRASKTMIISIPAIIPPIISTD